MTREQAYDWLAPKLSSSERSALDVIYNSLTPDPVENGGELVEKSGQVIMEWFVDLIDKQPESVLDEWKIGGCVIDLERRLASVLTAEVTRQVEERTRGYREALEKIKAMANTRGESGWSAVWLICEQALANKGGSDE